MEDLERDRAIVLEVMREVDRGHATAPELALERVAVGQRGLEPFQGLGQRDLSDWGASRLSAPDGAGPDSAADCYRFCYRFSGQKRAFRGREAGTDAR